MSLKRKLKSVIFSISRKKPVNKLILGSYHFIKPIAPSGLKRLYGKFPVNGNVKSRLDGSREFTMINDGRDSIANELYWRGADSYEHITVNLFPKLLMNTRVFFDIGANTGIYSLIAGSQNQEINIHAFEPVDTAYFLLERNVRINGFSNARVNQTALSNFDGTSEFNLQMADNVKIPLGSSLREDMGDTDNRRIIKVKTQKLDTYIKENNIEALDLMKVDTEGTEDKVFEGGKNTIDEMRPVIICEVLSNTNLEEKLHVLFDSRKYNYYFVNDNLLEQVDKIIGDPYVLSNYLLVPEEKVSVFLKGMEIKKISQKVFQAKS